MIKILKEIMNEGELCEIYDVHASRKFDVGFILDCDEEYYLMETFTRDGRYDGIQCRITDDVIKIQRGSEYLSAVKKLMPLYNYSRKEIPQSEKTVLDRMISFLRNEHKICTVDVDGGDCYISGYIEGAEEGILFISALDPRGKADGTAAVRIEDIDYISVDSEDELRLEILSR